MKTQKYLQDVDTEPDISCVLMSRLTALAISMRIYPQHSHFPGVLKALLSQDEIGWTPFFEGCVSNKWTVAQEQYYKQLASQRTGRRWVVELIQKFFDVAWDLWEHHNGIKHHKDNQETLNNMTEVNSETREHFRQGPGSMPQRVQYLFAGSVEDLLMSFIHHRLKWFETVKKTKGIQRECIQRQQTSFEASAKIMEDWLRGRCR
jgi:hypothetical protein